MGDGLFPALVIGASALPAFLLARSFARDRPRMATVMRLVGLAMLAGALGLAWAGGDRTRTFAVAIAMALAVNVLALLVLVDVIRRRRGGR
ncbi:hypothetical protein E4582_05760 [Luteimonas yindakuii]|uniref:Uncharacterized protein n=1 Tax=Luteimonas yindakuii TaxID=2565782 RepID=A0A4Z1RJM2_9GAMM|nr:hypothetical protein [Luteimonas yindakuii]QCO67982.1 hypothetical protein E5843_09800 [Luteimonas yindakuii]TKS54319.1 hypothetical protein E4582_05760 [Luteimonas yindakuii]